MIPDGEALVTAYLDAQTSERIVSRTPSDPSTSWVRLTQLDAANEAKSTPEHLIEFFFQLDCYAGKSGGHAEASTLVRTIRAALVAMPENGVDGATVSKVRFSGMPRIPDTAFEPARERFVLDAHVWMH